MYTPVTVWIKDADTGKTRCADDWTKGLPSFTAEWWSGGNGSCDCNRHEVFTFDSSERDYYREGFTDELAPGETFCMGYNRYVVVKVEPMPDGMVLDDFNRLYPEELKR